MKMGDREIEFPKLKVTDVYGDSIVTVSGYVNMDSAGKNYKFSKWEMNGIEPVNIVVGTNASCNSVKPRAAN